MSGQFGVDPTVLTELAGTFDREAKGLAAPIHTFTATASEVGEAFGILGACDGATEKYQKLLSSTVKALGHLPDVLKSDADRLRINASRYQDADQAAIGHLRSVPRYQGA
ncbi:Excreted virulence factor EspC, type VII ESX diderm [Streptomyces sp. 2112.3]|uniref:type VII secretion target n=1 Tax=Streptomyces sp. 2112.3 TaxID=1881023 RepID=UPI000898C470|nr:type VII secretion target [Streptomyces sp. 2112.3]SEE65925.1 Excreted virulence factor EspC, type VII ESX diderm [Streptomyces sp. 2112.3]